MLAIFEDGADNSHDYREAFSVIDAKYWVTGDAEKGTVPALTPEDVAEVLGHNIEFGDYAETEVWLFGRTNDDRFFFLNSQCDTTGWDCQAGGHAYVSTSKARVLQFGMTLDERVKLAIPGCFVHDDCVETPELGLACEAAAQEPSPAKSRDVSEGNER